MGHGQAGRANARVLGPFHQGPNGASGTRHHRVAWSVEGRDAQAGIGGDQGLHLLQGRQEGDHAPISRQGLHQLAPGRDQPDPIGQVKHPGQMGCQDFAGAMAQQQVRPHAPAGPELAEGVAHHKQGRLGDGGLLQGLGRLLLLARFWKQHPLQGQLQARVRQGCGPVKGLPEHRMAAIEVPGHGPLLAALAADEEGHLARPAPGHGLQGGMGGLGRPGAGLCRGLASGKGLELAFQIGPIAG